jgi:hypothetical protein
VNTSYLALISSGPLTDMISSRNGASKSMAVSTHIRGIFSGSTSVSQVVRAVPCYSSTLQSLPHTAISQGSYAQTEVKKLILQRRSILRWVVRGKMILISSLETRGSMAPALETSALNRGGRSSRSRSSTLGGFVRHLSVQSTLIFIGLLPESHK